MGLQHEDLKNTVLDTITIDHFEPKSGSEEEVIVVAFYATDEDPAKDLDNFIERGSTNILDVEVSPNPDEDGNYVVFVELKRTEEFFECFDSLVKDVTNVAGNLEWKIKPYLADKEFDYDTEEWKEYVITLPEQYVSKQDFSAPESSELLPEESLHEFFRESLLLTLDRKDAIITLCDVKSKVILETIGFGTADSVLKEHDLCDAPVDLLSRDGRVSDIRKMLGADWFAAPIQDYLVIGNGSSNNILLAKLIS